MKTLGMFLMGIGIASLAILCTGIIGWMIPIDTDTPSPGSVGNTAIFWISILICVGPLCITGGAFAFFRGRHFPPTRAGDKKPGFGRPITASLVSLAFVAVVAFAGFRVMTRWNPDMVWAAKVIGEAEELQVLLASYHQGNGEYPKALDELEGDYTKPTDFLSRNATPTGRSRWFYDRKGQNDYQLEVTAYSWVSYHDSLVYRKSGDFAEPWFANREAGDWRDIGKWRYVKGFSRLAR